MPLLVKSLHSKDKKNDFGVDTTYKESNQTLYERYPRTCHSISYLSSFGYVHRNL